jgi:hypothetical protein
MQDCIVEQFKQACKVGDLQTLKNINVDGAIFAAILGMIGLKHACIHGHIHVVKWLCDNFKTTHDEMKLSLKVACNYGHFELAQWIADKCNISDTYFDECLPKSKMVVHC